MKKRGTLARVLDLAVEKLNLMQEYSTGSDKEIRKQDKVVRLLKVKFLKMCEKVKYNTKRLEAKTAFVTFDSEEAYERINTEYIKKSYWFGMPRRLKFHTTHSKESFPIIMQKCYAPSDYLWENLSTPAYIRWVKVLLANIAALAFLVIGFAVIIQVCACVFIIIIYLFLISFLAIFIYVFSPTSYNSFKFNFTILFLS